MIRILSNSTRSICFSSFAYYTLTLHELRFLSFLFVSLISYNTPQQQSAEPRNSAGAEAPARGQKTKGCIEGEDPAAAGIERFFSLKGPQEEKNVRTSFCLSAVSRGAPSPPP